MISIAQPLTEFLLRMNGEPSPALEQAIKAVCTAVAEGHVCLPLSRIPYDLARAVHQSRIVGEPADFRPLIVDLGNLYLARYHHYESRLASHLQHRAEAAPIPVSPELQQRLKAWTDDPAQQRAVLSTLSRQLSIVTGGPGTGKTRTATIALVLLAEQLGGRRFALAAPTGKAAARISSALAETLSQFEVAPAVRRALEVKAMTLHRLLGVLPGESRFRYHADHPLPVDVLVVDEASMIDLPMMTKLLDALRPDTRLLLLGDRDQLASVEAGHILGDICSGATGALAECVADLTTNHRFKHDSGIHRFSAAARTGDVASAERLLQSDNEDLFGRPMPGRLSDALRVPLVTAWREVMDASSPEEALRRLGGFRILCGLRDGMQGVIHLNQLSEHVLAAAGLIKPGGTHYPGRPILILRNDYQLKLFNGDLGLVLRDANGELRAYFEGEGGAVRDFAPARLPEHETAFAMTVHKAQGSEFDSVLVVLPTHEHPIVSRELVYTAVTRAKHRAEVWWNEAGLRAALNRRVTRWSGLRERLAL